MGIISFPSPRESGSARYTLRLKGHLNDRWTHGSAHLSLTHEDDGTTTLSGEVDEAALYGLLRQVRDAGIVLLSVVRADPAVSPHSDDTVSGA